MSNSGIITVSQLNYYVKSLIESDSVLSAVFLSGEISNLTDHYRSGHIYLSLKDEKSTIKCVMFAGHASKLKFALQNGMKVIAAGRVSIYEATGQYQFYVEQIQPDGIGAFTVAYEALKRKLEAEGLFDQKRKKQIPKYPETVGVITSPTGAVRRDIENVLKRRYPVAQIQLYPATVQGDNAPKELVAAINYFNQNPVDVLIIGRGGGSIEDLWAFNDEKLARSIAESEIPIISAVGHETDFTICDFAADLRAPTPSAAAELATPDMEEMISTLKNIQFTLQFLMKNQLEAQRKRVKLLTQHRTLSSPRGLIEEKRLELDQLTDTITSNFKAVFSAKRQCFSELAAKLQVLSPLSSLSRGYAIVLKENKPVNTIKKIKAQDELKLILSDGELTCTVNDIKE